MFILGVTGEFGSGKSTVAAMFHARGARVIDADKIVHDLFRQDPVCRKKVRAAFGDGVLTSSGVDRQKLGRMVFGKPKALKTLEAIVHPLVKTRVLKKMQARGARVTVLDVPLLIEAGWKNMVDALIVVKACRRLEIERLQKRTGLSRAEILRRLKRQMPVREKVKYADMIIDNRRTLADTDRQVGKIWDILNK